MSKFTVRFLSGVSESRLVYCSARRAAAVDWVMVVLVAPQTGHLRKGADRAGCVPNSEPVGSRNYLDCAGHHRIVKERALVWGGLLPVVGRRFHGEPKPRR